MSADKEFATINALIEQTVTNELETYRNKMGKDMSSIELIAYTTGIYEGFKLALDWADKKTSERTDNLR